MPPIVPKDVLTKYFESGDKPTAAQFGSLIRSMVNISDDRYLLGLRDYDSLKLYLTGDSAIYSNAIYQCIAETSGTFNPVKWNVIASFGSVVYTGTWDARLSVNEPPLESGEGTKGFYYVVTDADADPSNNVNLDGIDFWQVGDWAIFNGTVWQIVRNSTVPIKAADVIFEPTPTIDSENVQDAIEEVAGAKQDLLKLKATFYPYAADTSKLADGVISNESDGIALSKGKAFRSDVPNKAQLNFGESGNSVFITTESGKFSESTLDLEPNSLYLKHAPSGKLTIAPGFDGRGELILINSVNNNVTINGDYVVAQHLSGAQLKISDGMVEAFADTVELSSPSIILSDLDPDTVLCLNSNSEIESSLVTPLELSYLTGVTSSVQTQLNGKENTLGFTPVPDTRTVNGYALTSDITVNAAVVPQDSSNRFVTDAQISDWNAKQNALGFTPVPNTRTVNGYALTSDITVNAAVVPQDSSNRFVTDAQISDWNAKQNALGFTPVPDTRTVNGHALTADVVVTKSDLSLSNVTDDRQLSQKAYYSNEALVATSTSSTFAPVFTEIFSLSDAGDYMIEWYYEIGSSTTGGDAGSQVSFDGSIIGSSTIKGGVADGFVSTHGFIQQTALSASSHTFLIELNRPTSGGTASLRRPRFTMTKI
jgi:hypothetical protein